MTDSTAPRLSDIIAGTQAETLGSLRLSEPITSVTTDSRLIERGSLFIALVGAKHDGHDFVTQAFASGALAVIVSRIPEDCTWGEDGPPLLIVPDTLKALQDLAQWWRGQHRADVIGVTGSVGKTTTKEVTAAVLGQRGPVLFTEGNLNTEIGLPLTLLRLRPTHKAVVLEMGMYALGDIRLLAQIAEPRLGIVTNVQSSHLERLGTLERIADAKAELPESLPPSGTAILNADDARVRAMAERTRARTVLYGLSADAHVRATNPLSHGLRGVEFRLHIGAHSAQVHLPLLGLHSIHAALAAAAAATELGFSLDEAAEALYKLSPSLRILIARGLNGSRIIDDTYNANPESVLAGLNLLADLDGRKIAVLGDMLELGSDEEPGHRKVGSRAARVTGLLVTVGDRMALAADEARASGMKPEQVIQCATNTQAIEALRRSLRPGDNVLIKGSRGMQMEEIVSAVRLEG
ncbi:MAG: UDP-N-acetylmuramoyl-tripeptide--D-alanyl-D-alanine ligase [Chloroflexota bacterium]